MKKLNEIFFTKKVTILGDKQMKEIEDNSGKKSSCAYSTTTLGDLICAENADEAEEKSGIYGWWCCNCQEATDAGC